MGGRATTRGESELTERKRKTQSRGPKKSAPGEAPSDPRRAGAPEEGAESADVSRSGEPPYPIVAIGASAGGLEAFTQLLEHLPQDTGMAFVLIQHLDPTRESMLREILARSTPMRVLEVREGMAVEPNRVYVMPAQADVGLVDGSFKLVPRKRTAGRDMPIDYFFASLADRYESRAVGIILSGTMTDGSLGLKAIKDRGGVTFAQDESTAKFADMPRAAVAAGAVDLVLSPHKIAEELARLARFPLVRPASPLPDSAPETEGAEHQKVLALLRNATGVDFQHYRQTTVRRRIARRMSLRRMDTEAAYLDLLRKDRAELQALYDDILITVTAFFRDPEVFKALQETVFPAMLKDRRSDAPVRLWVPGCSTGEEVYSLAISLFESLQALEVNPPLQIFATDISDAAIDKARTGIYLENSVVDVSTDRLRRFFVKTESGYQISKTIRDVCVFARQNITADPPFSTLDLVSCRNLLIYLEPVLQKRVLPLFHYALKPGGVLLLGNAESIAGFGDLFLPLDRNQRIFAKRPGSPRQTVTFGRTEAQVADLRAPIREGAPPPVTPVDLQKEADRMVLGRFGPAGVLVNDAFEILQFRGRTAAYLEVPPGAATFNLLKMAREGLLVELRDAILKARKTNRSVRREGLKIRQDGHVRRIALEVLPLKDDGSGARHYLVLFDEGEPRAAAGKSPRAAPSRTRGADHETIVQLEQELTATKDYLQSIIEEQEASNEELKSANEEILSSNEELQSTNEELETAKEELQSTNEELTTVNEELQVRNVELSQVNGDLLNLLAGSQIALLMLGADGRLRRFTPQAERLFNLIPTDVGRRLADIRFNVKVPDLEELVQHVVQTVGSREREVQDQDGNWYLMRIRPYRTIDNRIDGAVVTFVDIDPIKRSLEQVHRARDYAESLVETVREALVVLDESLAVRTANQSFYRMFRVTPMQTEGKHLLEPWNVGDKGAALQSQLEKVVQKHEQLHDVEIELDFDGIGRKDLLVNARRVRLPGEGGQTLVLVAFDDVTTRRSAERALRTSEARYRRIFETAQEGILLLDGVTGEILDANPFLTDMLGWSREDLAGKKPWEIGVYDDPDGQRARFEDLKRTGLAFEPEVLMRARGGQRVWVETIWSVHQSDGHAFVQCNLRDTSERRTLQEQLRQVQKLDSIGTLAGGIAHDFNNILNIVSAHVALLERDRGPEARTASAASIQQAVQRGSGLVKQLLTFARKTETVFVPVNLNAVLRDLAKMISETFPKNVRLDLAPDPALPMIRGDVNQLTQAFLNLAVNARDAMPGGGTLTLATERVAGAELARRIPEAAPVDYVCARVTDSGGGMDEPTKRRIFEPFFTTKGSNGGQGLGLAVVYGVVNAHHGLIEVESEPGKGTRFDLYFPAAGNGGNESGLARDEKERPGSPPGAPETPSGRAASRASSRGRVLFVEDEELLLEPVKTMLESEGYEVLTATNGAQAVDLHAERRGRIDAVVIDLGLPKLGGLEAFRKMQAADPNLKCIVASGNLESEKRQEMREAGVKLSLRKPYGIPELLNALEQVLGP